jgi:hypothetical protein
MSGKPSRKASAKSRGLTETARVFPELIGLQTLELLMDQEDDKAITDRVLHILAKAAQHPENRIRARAWELLEKFQTGGPIEMNIAENDAVDGEGELSASAGGSERTIMVERIYRQVRADGPNASAVVTPTSTH